MSLVSGVSYPVTVSWAAYAPSKSTIVSYTSSILFGSSGSITIQSRDDSGNPYYSPTYTYTFMYTGPVTGSGTPVHSANGLYSRSYSPSKTGLYTLSVQLSNGYTTANPSVSKEISGSPLTASLTVIGPTWSTGALTQTKFFIYGSAADTVTLPA
jgi:hypothetical protein